VVTVYDAGQDDGRLWIALRWVEGGEDLGDRIDAVGGPLDLATTLDVLDQIGGAREPRTRSGSCTATSNRRTSCSRAIAPSSRTSASCAGSTAETI
jgi:hypothetical protein